jgi:hypothetical protein
MLVSFSSAVGAFLACDPLFLHPQDATTLSRFA